MIVRKGQRRLDGIDKIVIGLYAHGMTVRDIQTHLLDIYEIEVSADLISQSPTPSSRRSRTGSPGPWSRCGR